MKYDWIKLEKEFILSSHKTVSSFLKEKGISINGSTKEKTKGWKEKKGQKEYQKSTKIIEKITEQEIEKEVEQKVKIDEVAQNLLEKINKAVGQLNMNTDMFGKVHESEIINRADIKRLTSALKDISDISKNASNTNNNDKATPKININIIDNSNLEEDLWRDFNENNK